MDVKETLATAAKRDDKIFYGRHIVNTSSLFLIQQIFGKNLTNTYIMLF
jgi:hypothetical protein